MIDFTEAHRQQIAYQLQAREPDLLKNEHVFCLMENRWHLVGMGSEQFVDVGMIAGADAYLHTHPVPCYEPLIPSRLDMQVMASSDKPQGIMNYCRYEQPVRPVFWHESIQANQDSLVGRHYRWGDYGSDGKGDCFAVIADWYRLNRCYVFPVIPRDFYDKQGFYYTENFHGLTRIREANEPLTVGDLLVIRVGRQGEHAGVYVGDGLMLHHPMNGTSRLTPIHATMQRLHMRLEVLGG